MRALAQTKMSIRTPMRPPKLSFAASPLSVPFLLLDPSPMADIPTSQSAWTSARKRVGPVSRDEPAATYEHAKKPRVGMPSGAWVPPPTNLLLLARAKCLLAFELEGPLGCVSAQCVSLSWARSDDGELKYSKEKRLCSKLGAQQLSEFYADVADMHEYGAVVAYRLAEKTIILENLFAAHGLMPLGERWKVIARKGFCLGDPEVGRWLDVKRKEVCPRGLCQELLRGVERPSSSGAEATRQYLSIAENMCRLAQPPCAQGEAEHEYVSSWDCAYRDNGEHYAVCRVCGACE